MRGRRFLHPRLGFTFTAPDRFTLENTAQAVLGVRDNGDAALRLDVVRVPAEQTLAEYLGSGWIENVDKRSIEEIDDQRPAGRDRDRHRAINGRSGSTRSASAARSIASSSPRRSEHRSDRAPLFGHDVPPHDDERDRVARPLRLKVVAVKHGDTVENSPRRMPRVDRPPSASSSSTGSARENS